MVNPIPGFETLNANQKSAALHTDGPLVIYAGAGSGKTKTICYRIAHLISSGVYPYRILSVTFTNKAAREMKHRVEDLLGKRAVESMLVSTFHSACARILRHYATEIGFTQSFSIYDDSDQKSLLKNILAEFNIPEKTLPVNTVKSTIDKWKNAGETPELVQLRKVQAAGQKAKSLSAYRAHEDEELIHKIYGKYQDRLKQQNAMDFNDLILNTIFLLESKPQILERLQNRFQYLLVDEFQDTNPAQFKFVQLLSEKHQNLCIVGDDDQSIYSWRGAEPDYILNFTKFYPNAAVYKLEQNYRSTHLIVQAASDVIKHNRNRVDKQIWSSKVTQSKISLKSCLDASDEARHITRNIKRQKDNNHSFSSQAILYRTNAQSRSLEDELRKQLIPYVIYGSVRFYDRAEIKLALSYLKLLLNPNDIVSLEKALSAPRRGIGDKTFLSLIQDWQANGQNASLISHLHRVANGETSFKISRGNSGLKSFTESFVKIQHTLNHCSNIYEVFTQLMREVALEDFLVTQYPEDAEERKLNLHELGLAMNEESLEAQDVNSLEAESQSQEPLGKRLLIQFLNHAALASEPTTVGLEQGTSDAVTLMSIHSSKGLEYETVYLAGLEEGTLPHYNSLESSQTIEEERRLMYVGMTRAKEYLFLSHSNTHRFKPDLWVEPSRFLEEINPALLERDSLGKSARPKINRSYLDSEWDDNPAPFAKKSDTAASHTTHSQITYESLSEDIPWQKGQRVKHKTFGTGTIKGIEKSNQGYKLDVQFSQVGSKKILESFLEKEDYF
jgi:DNA helicase-2/ATP-dependent DNA helicase PcrA